MAITKVSQSNLIRDSVSEDLKLIPPTIDSVSSDGNGGYVIRGAGFSSNTQVFLRPINSSLQAYTYYRWSITAVRSSGCQASEFVFKLDGVDQSMAGVTASAVSAYASEGPDKLVDGNVGTKWYTGTTPSAGSPLVFTFTFPSARTFNGYRWSTANDADGRDPKTWKIFGSQDNSNWIELDDVVDYPTTTSRNTNVGTFTFDEAFLPIATAAKRNYGRQVRIQNAVINNSASITLPANTSLSGQKFYAQLYDADTGLSAAFYEDNNSRIEF